MKKPVRLIVAVVCIAGILVSAGITAYMLIKADRNVLGEWLAPVRINVEIEKEYAADVSIYSPSSSWRQNFPVFTRAAQYETGKNTLLYVQLDPDDFHRNIYLRIPADAADGAINAIDNISVFIGNKLCYYPAADIQKFSKSTDGAYSLFRIPDLYYTKSLFVSNWANYYGDLNLAIKAVFNFLLYPLRFPVPYLFLFFLIFIYRREIAAAYTQISKRQTFWITIALLVVIAAGLILRLNGYVRHSGWSDELYSALRAGNPNYPLIATFMDSGNPPFYFMLLRYWFKIFGWTEESGTMLSVILGTLAIPALFLLIKENCGKKTALLASFFMMLSGFAIGYSQEMRAYILQMFLAPVTAVFFMRFIKKQNVLNLLPYTVMSIILANTHYYGILFIMANFVFYCFYETGNKSFTAKKLLVFLCGNVIAALSFIPYFLYQLIVVKTSFQRTETIGPEHVAMMAIIVILAAVIFINRKKITLKIFRPGQAGFFLYVFSVPVLIFSISFLISIVKPMIDIKYLLPISFPFFLAACSVLISVIRANKKLQYISVLLVWMLALVLYAGKSGITSSGYAFYREARAYIAADAAAHPELKSCMLDNAPQNAAYYGYPQLPQYSPDKDYDVVYVYNDIYGMNEADQMTRLKDNNLTADNMMIVIPDDQVAIFKKYLH